LRSENCSEPDVRPVRDGRTSGMESKTSRREEEVSISREKRA
jgi:hypothetical protein